MTHRSGVGLLVCGGTVTVDIVGYRICGGVLASGGARVQSVPSGQVGSTGPETVIFLCLVSVPLVG